MKFRVEKRHCYLVTDSITKQEEVGDNLIEVEFEFDAEWSGITKTARFSKGWEGEYVDKLITNGKCSVSLPYGEWYVGVMSTNLTTTPCKVEMGISEKSYNGYPAPAQSIYQQILDKLDSLSGADPDMVAEQIEAYFEEHPIDGLTDDDVNTLIAAYLEENPQGVDTTAVNTLIASYLTANPQGLSESSVNSLIASYLTAHPQGVDESSVNTLIANYLTAHPQGLSESAVNGLIASYLTSNPQGLSETAVNNLIAAYLTAHPQGVDESSVNTLIAAYITAHPEIGSGGGNKVAYAASATSDTIIKIVEEEGEEIDLLSSSDQLDLNDTTSPIKYRVGIVSDIHINVSSQSESALDFANALSIFDDYGCDFVASCGDIPTSERMSDKASEAMPQAQNFKAIREATEYADKLYACRGNHDWVYTDSEMESINGHPCNTYFKIGTDAFVFLSYSVPSSYTSDSMYTSTDADALQSMLTYWNSIESNLADCKRIFVFSHFPLYNYAGYGANKVYGWDSAKTNTLLTKFKKNNVLYFCGHSHIKYQEESRFDYIKFKQDTGTNFSTISVPSLTNARTIKDDGTVDWDVVQSSAYGQAIIMDVCDSCVIIHGIDVEEAVTIDNVDLGDAYTYVVNKLDKNALRKDLYRGIMAVDNAFANVVVADSEDNDLADGTSYFDETQYNGFHGSWNTYKGYVNNAFTSLSEYTSAMKSIGIGLFDKTRTDMKVWQSEPQNALIPSEYVSASRMGTNGKIYNGTQTGATLSNAILVHSGDTIEFSDGFMPSDTYTTDIYAYVGFFKDTSTNHSSNSDLCVYENSEYKGAAAYPADWRTNTTFRRTTELTYHSEDEHMYVKTMKVPTLYDYTTHEVYTGDVYLRVSANDDAFTDASIKITTA